MPPRCWVLCVLACGLVATDQSQNQPNNERDALVHFFAALDGPKWSRSDKWNTSELVCSWEGITCSKAQDVQSMSLRQNKLKGSVPDLQSLEFLEELLLTHSELQGRFPINLPTSLIHLELSSCDLSGALPSNLGQLLPNLQELDMSSNSLEGTIPKSVASMSLTMLVLGRNSITGPIPTQIGLLTNLVELRLEKNTLQSGIPTELGKLLRLRVLELSANQLTGEIPTELGALQNLETLAVNANLLTGPLPTELANCISLRFLDLSNNMLVGSVPAMLGRLPSLKWVDLSNNLLKAPQPRTSACANTFAPSVEVQCSQLGEVRKILLRAKNSPGLVWQLTMFAFGVLIFATCVAVLLVLNERRGKVLFQPVRTEGEN